MPPKAYTVKDLAKLSGVSVRTLHWYDEIGLLKPAYQGANAYRYYQEAELLQLQQILFFKELGFDLNSIQRLLSQDDFDNLNALLEHKKKLEAELARKQDLIATIDKTIHHIKGKQIMTEQEFYYGFDSEKQKEHEKFLVEKQIITQEFLDESNAKIKNWTENQKIEFIQDMDKILNGLATCLKEKLTPSSKTAQDLMQRHYGWLKLTWFPTNEKYLGLSSLYQTPEFRVCFDRFHPELVEYLIEAMRCYAEQNL